MTACGGKETENDGIWWDETAGGPTVKKVRFSNPKKAAGKKYSVDMARFG